MNYKLAKQYSRKPWQLDLIKAGYKGRFDLGSLIEECGRDFVSLLYVEGSGTEIPGVKWEAWGDNKNYGFGISPEESVAELWLKLNY